MRKQLRKGENGRTTFELTKQTGCEDVKCLELKQDRVPKLHTVSVAFSGVARFFGTWGE
jgi:hypothetical protein